MTLKKRNRKRYTNISQLLVLGGSCISPLGRLDSSVFLKCSITCINYFYNQEKKVCRDDSDKMRGRVSQSEEAIFSLIGSANKGGNVAHH